MICSVTNIRVRYSETDKMGYLHHANYLNYFEVGRTETLRNMGLTYREMEEDGILLPVLSVNINYKAPAYYDDILTVKTYLKKIPGVKVLFEYEILNDNSEIICTGDSTLVFIDANSRRPRKPPAYFMEKCSAEFKQNRKIR
jgi:acyl-CoA thioester hydrolase